LPDRGRIGPIPEQVGVAEDSAVDIVGGHLVSLGERNKTSGLVWHRVDLNPY